MSLLAVAAVLVAAAPAVAAERHASPGGASSDPCSETAPCSFGHAVTGAAAGDEVIVAPGDYGSEAAPLTANAATSQPNVVVRGVPGRPRPRIFSNALSVLTLWGAGSRASHLELRSLRADGFGLDFWGARAEDLIVRSQGATSTACRLQNTSTIANSVCLNAGGTRALSVAAIAGPNDVTVRNVTAIGTAPTSVGVQVQSGAGVPSAARLVNTIADGGAYDVQVAESTGQASLATTHSLYRTTHRSAGAELNEGAGNLDADAAFVDRARENFHQTPRSPTIDAGEDAPENGAADLDGDARKIGPRTDIGADEAFYPPIVSTGAALDVRQTSAVLTGDVATRNIETETYFEYGTTAAYGSVWDRRIIPPASGSAGGRVPIFGLAPGTTYHYRLVATNSFGTAYGANRTFTTLESGAPGGTEPRRCANQMQGTEGPDLLTGTPFGDQIFGDFGNDRLNGGAGEDCLYGDSGNDRISGGDGDDLADGGRSRDRVSGDAGHDRLNGNSGNDRVLGGTGDDRLAGAAGNDLLIGGAGHNTFNAGAGNDKLRTANGVPETVKCGRGRRDRATVDRADRPRGCERVRRR